MAKAAAKTESAPQAKRRTNKKREEEESPQAANSAFFSSWKLKAGVGLIFLLAAVGGALLVFSSADKATLTEVPHRRAPKIAYIEDPDHVLAGAVVSLPLFVVNLHSDKKFLRLGLALEFYDFEQPADLKQKIPLLQDAVISTVSRHTAEELLAEETRKKLRKELIAAMNHILKPENPVVRLYFSQFLVEEQAG